MSDQLKQAVAYIKAGDKKAGRTVLVSLLKQDPTNSHAWMYLSALVSTPEKKRQCLEEAIEHDPDNETARNALAKLNQKYPPPPLYAETAESYEDEEMWLPDSFKTTSLMPEPQIQTSSPVQPQASNNMAVTNEQKQRESVIEASIVRALAVYRRPKDIAQELAEKGMDYNQALGYVLYVSQKKRREIALRRMPLIFAISGITFVVGIGAFLTAITFRGVIFGIAMIMSSFAGVWLIMKDFIARN